MAKHVGDSGVNNVIITSSVHVFAPRKAACFAGFRLHSNDAQIQKANSWSNSDLLSVPFFYSCKYLISFLVFIVSPDPLGYELVLLYFK